jgi:hypothetical protein
MRVLAFLLLLTGASAFGMFGLLFSRKLMFPGSAVGFAYPSRVIESLGGKKGRCL